VVGVILFAFMWMMPSSGFTFSDCLYFGAITSATVSTACFRNLNRKISVWCLSCNNRIQFRCWESFTNCMWTSICMPSCLENRF
jgi:multisubunit Na+/H+ antiporter MnhE subunit